MSSIIDNNTLTMEATGTGYQSAIGQMRIAAPAGSDMMVMVFRAYFDTFTANESANYGWSNPSAFGLSFNGTIPMPSNHSNFFGLSSRSAGGDTVELIYNADAFGTGEAGVAFGVRSNLSTWNGATVTQPGNSLTSSLSPKGPWDLPANPTTGAKYTGIWIIKADRGTSNVRFQSGFNLESLALDNLRDAKDDAETVWYNTSEITFAESTNWRPTIQTMKFPSYFVFSFPSGVPGKKMIIERIGIDWFSYNQLVGTTSLTP